MPSRLRPTSSLAADAVLVGDPGRALLLAQELLTQPKMSNHARGLWGYSGETPAGRPLTVQATGMGGPSAAIVLADLVKLGVRRAVRVGSCAGLATEAAPGELLVVGRALAGGGSAAAVGVRPGEEVAPDPELTSRLETELGAAAKLARIASLDAFPGGDSPVPEGAVAADLQTVSVLGRAAQLGIAAAATLIVAEVAGGERAADQRVEDAAKRAGAAAGAALST